MKSFKNNFILFLKGACMGSADIVPGISGGTVALLLGIYEALLTALASFNLTALRLLRQQKWALLWQHIHGTFLFTLGSGLIISLLTTARIVTYCLAQYPIPTWSFFNGLLLVGTLMVYEKIHQVTFRTILLSVAGSLIAVWMRQATPIVMDDTLASVFIAGAISICAMILPGVSGSYILLLLGKYKFMLQALLTFQWKLIITFSVGAGLSLLSFVRLLQGLLRRFHDGCIAFLAGFVFGTLPQISPWRLPMATAQRGIDSVVFTKAVMPSEFQQVTGQDPLLLQAVIGASIGALLVLGLTVIRKKY